MQSCHNQLQATSECCHVLSPSKRNCYSKQQLAMHDTIILAITFSKYRLWYLTSLLTLIWYLYIAWMYLFLYNMVGHIFIADYFLKLKVFICARINRLHTLMETQASMMIVIDAHFKGSFSFQPTVCCSSYFWFVSSQPRVKLQLDLNSKEFHLLFLKGQNLSCKTRKSENTWVGRKYIEQKERKRWAEWKWVGLDEFNACIDLISCRHWHDSVRGSRSVRRPGEQPRIPTKKRTSESLCFFLGIPQPAGFTRTWCSCTTLDFPNLYLVPSSDVLIIVVTISEMVSREGLVFKRLNAWAMSIRPWSTNCEFARYEEHHFLHTWQWERAFPEENISWWAVDAHGSYIFAESSYRVSNKQTKYMKILDKRKFLDKHILILSCAEANYSFFWLSFVAICWCMDWLALWFICSLYKPT